MANDNNLLEKLKTSWTNMDSKKKKRLIIIIISLILFLAIYGLTVKKVNYVVLFSDLNLEDAGVIVSDLESKKIKYKLDDAGRTILIDKKKIDKYRIEIAMEGKMPESSSGFEIFDDSGLMVTDDDRKIMYQRALEGELQRSIVSLDSIKNAKVHLVMSEKSIFEIEEKNASASVILDIKPGIKVSENMVKGISELVSGAVNNLPIENIKILDSKGNLLSNFLYDESEIGANLLENQYKIKYDFENKIERNLTNLLEDIFGIDKIRVAVNADLDFDSEESTIIKYDEPKLRSEHLNIAGDNIETMPEDSLIGDNASNVIGSVRGEGSVYNHIRNNELDQQTTNIIKAPGKLTKLTTSVIYDGELSENMAEKIQSIVATAVGYDINREDLISVVGIEFDRSAQEDIINAFDDAKGDKTLFNKYKFIMLAIILLALALTIVVMLIRRARSKKQEEMLALEEELLMAKDRIDKKDEELEVEKGIKTPSIEELTQIEKDSDDAKAKTYAEQNPDMAADLIRAWMKE